jgi:hypothetical protein
MFSKGQGVDTFKSAGKCICVEGFNFLEGIQGGLNLMKRGKRSFKDYAEKWLQRSCDQCGKVYWARKRRVEKKRNLTCSNLCGTLLSHKNPEYSKNMTQTLLKEYRDGKRTSPFQGPKADLYRSRINQKKRLRLSALGRATPESREKTRQQMLLRWKDRKWKKAFSKKMIAKWKEEGYKEKTLQAMVLSIKSFGTDIELIVKAKLDEHKIKYKFQKPTSFKWKDRKVVLVPDFIIGKTIIECQGDYHHCNAEFFDRKAATKAQKECMARDKFKSMVYPTNGYKFHFIWGSQIKDPSFNIKKYL